VNPAQERALEILNKNREGLVKDFPNQWIAMSADGKVRAAPRFDLLIEKSDIDPAQVVFAFAAVGAWA
jgi:hypothetical protein